MYDGAVYAGCWCCICVESEVNLGLSNEQIRGRMKRTARTNGDAWAQIGTQEDNLAPSSVSEPCPTSMLWVAHRRASSHYQGTTHTSGPGLREAAAGALGNWSYYKSDAPSREAVDWQQLSEHKKNGFFPLTFWPSHRVSLLAGQNHTENTVQLS